MFNHFFFPHPFFSAFWDASAFIFSSSSNNYWFTCFLVGSFDSFAFILLDIFSWNFKSSLLVGVHSMRSNSIASCILLFIYFSYSRWFFSFLLMFAFLASLKLCDLFPPPCLAFFYMRNANCWAIVIALPPVIFPSVITGTLRLSIF